MSRIVTKETPQTREAVATVTQIVWDPYTNDGYIDFQVVDQVKEGGVDVGLRTHTRLRSAAGMSTIRIPLSEFLTEVISYTNMMGQPATLAGPDFMLATKAYFDAKFVQRLAEQEAADSAPPEEPLNLIPPTAP